MNISTLAKILGVSLNDLKSAGQKNGIYGFAGRNTRIPYQSAIEVTKVLKPERLAKLQNDDKIYLPSSLTVADFAEVIGKPTGMVLKTLVLNGVMATLNEKIDYDTASLIANEMGVEVFPEDGVFEANTDDINLIKTIEYDIPDEDRVFVKRLPVVTVMGHVDHGKTTLLDTIRKTNRVASESGSITQHISSYQVEINYKKESDQSPVKQKITFIDTPGHEAFTAMRARGSQLADFIILVVSAVEGPKPQTVEVIERAKLAKVPVIVAMNKTDLPESDTDRVKSDISAFGLIPEEWGGDTPFIPISAKTAQNIDKLLETIALMAEMAELKGEVHCPGQAVVIESHMDKNVGVIATVLVVKDKIKVSDIVRSGENVSKIRRIQNSEGKNINEAGISEPVLVYGLPTVMDIGEPILAYKSQKQAQLDATAEKFKKQKKPSSFIISSKKADDNQINLIIKADVTGSLEAIKETIIKIPQDKVKIVIKKEGVGNVNENDIEFAKITGSTILAFHTRNDSRIENIVRQQGVSMIESDIIYQLLEWLEEQIIKNTKYEIKITVLGVAEVLALFKSEMSNQQVFGGQVKTGKIFSNKQLRLVRDGKDMGRLDIVQLQRNKSKTAEVISGQEFGISATSRVKIAKGDFIESIDETVIK